MDDLAQSVNIYDEATQTEAKSLAEQLKTNIGADDIERNMPLAQFCSPLEAMSRGK